jgi:hypothetical protein
MLASITATPINLLSLGSRVHGILLAGEDKICGEVFSRDGGICRVCGISAPGCMEIDHIKTHARCGAEGLATICTFCHDLRHPLWSASRGRIIPVFAPELSQVDVTRLAWTVLGYRGDASVDISGLVSGIKSRARRMEDLVGCAGAEPLFEAAFTAMQMMGPEKGREVMLKVDQSLRFWPTEVFTEKPDENLPPAARMSSWRLGGFRVFAEDAAKAFRGAQPIDPERLMKAAAAIQEAS